MVVRKKIYRKKRVFKKRIYRKRGPQRLLPRGNRRAELKSNEVNLENVSVDYNGYKSLMNGIDQGTTARTRIGNLIKMKYYNVQLNFSVSTPMTIKIALVYDKQTTGTAFPFSDYLNAISTFFYPWCQRRQDTRDRFVTLKEKIINVAPQIANVAVNRELNIYGLIRKGVECVYNGSGSTVGAINKGSLYLYITTSTNTGCVVNGSFKVKYTDD